MCLKNYIFRVFLNNILTEFVKIALNIVMTFFNICWLKEGELILSVLRVPVLFLFICVLRVPVLFLFVDFECVKGACPVSLSACPVSFRPQPQAWMIKN